MSSTLLGNGIDPFTSYRKLRPRPFLPPSKERMYSHGCAASATREYDVDVKTEQARALSHASHLELDAAPHRGQ